MKIQFCDVCNESVPLADVDEGRAVLRSGRVTCARCEAAMSAGTALGASVPPAAATPVVHEVYAAPVRAAAHAVPLVHAAPATSPAPVPRASGGGMSFGVTLAGVALLVALGGGTFLFERFDQRARTLEEELARVRGSIDERARLAASGLEGDVRAAGTGLGEVRGSVGELSRRLDETDRERATSQEALRGEVGRLSERLAALVSVESALERHESELDDLARINAELRAELAGVNERVTSAESAPAGEAPPAAATDAATEKGSEPAWVNWLADLSSPDSGTRWQAVQSLGATGDRSVATHILPMLGDSDIFVRMAAARILGDLGAVEAIPGLIDALEDQEMSVREQALASLRKVSRQNLPFDPDAKDAERAKRVKAWREWWERARDDLSSAKERRPS